MVSNEVQTCPGQKMMSNSLVSFLTHTDNYWDLWADYRRTRGRDSTSADKLRYSDAGDGFSTMLLAAEM